MPVKTSGLLLCLLSISLTGTERDTTTLKNNLSSHIAYLASNELAGRGVGTRGIEQAAAYIADHFRSCGLQPGGDEGSYLQTVRIPLRTLASDACYLRVPGTNLRARYGVDYRPMPFSSDGAIGGPVVFAGYGVEDPQQDYDDYRDLDVNGKVVLMLRYEPDSWRDPDTGRWGRAARFTRKLSLAREHGAIGVLIVNPPQDGSEDALYPARNPGRQNFGLPAFHVKRSFADRLLAAGGVDDIATLTRRVNAGHTCSGEIPGVLLRARSEISTRTLTTHNVVGILPGEGSLAEQFVVFGAHYDHLGTVPPSRRPRLGEVFDAADTRIHNGADDNASGTSGLLELARQFAAEPAPARNLVFVAFTAEEIGLVGSNRFVDEPGFNMDDVTAMFNLDMIGRLDDRAVEVYGTGTAAEWIEMVQRHAQPLGLKIESIPAPGSRSDHAAFYREGVPVLFPFSGMHEDYHRPEDDIEKIDLEGAARIVQLIRGIAGEVIDRPQGLSFQRVNSAASIPLKVRIGIVPAFGTRDDQEGWLVGSVLPDGPAAAAGILPQDRILAIDGKRVSSMRDYQKIMAPYEPGQEVAILIRREGEDRTVQLTLMAR